jgi:hypothetical protein
MVSAKTNGNNDQIFTIRKNDGIIGKTPRRKKAIDRPRGCYSEGNVNHNSANKFSNQKAIRLLQTKTFQVRLRPQAPVKSQVNANELNSARIESCIRKVQINNAKATEIQIEDEKFKQILDQQKEEPPQKECDIPRSYKNKPNLMASIGRNRIAEICGYIMKIDQFNGCEEEDYDIWWEDLKAFFELYSLTEEEDKINLFKAHLGGEARRFIQNEDLRSIKTVEQLNLIFQNNFSRNDWPNVLMNIKQGPYEKIRTYSIRIKLAARKCGLTGVNLDKMCVCSLKHNCNPQFKDIMNYCLPSTPFDVLVQHAIQFERASFLRHL